MQQAKNGDKVKVHYHGKLNNGETFDSSEGREPLQFEIGSGSVIEGFDTGVTGMSVGEKKTINIPFDKAYGAKKQEMMFEIPKERFPSDLDIQVGLPLMMSDGSGKNFQVTVAQVKNDTIVLDANHPLAGHDLTFEIELVEIENSSKIIMP